MSFPHGLISTGGVPPILNTRFPVFVMTPYFFQRQVEMGITRFRRIELHISASPGADLKILSEIPFDELKIQSLVITHYLRDASPHAVISVWSCTQKILMHITKLTGLTELVIREPFPPEMLCRRASHGELVADLRRKLTSTDAYLCELIEDSPTVFKVCRPRLEDGHSTSCAADARICELFPALHMRDFIRVE